MSKRRSFGRLVTGLLLSLLAICFLLFFMERPVFGFAPFGREILNFYARYEGSTILVSLGLLCLLYLLADKQRLHFLNLRHLDGPVKPVPMLGITPKTHEGWKVIGLTIGSIITVVTGCVVYLQVAAGNGMTFQLFPELPMVFLFALMNSFTEEVVFRLSFATIVANEDLGQGLSEALSAVSFGAVHYFGIAPSGLPGAAMAAFIGWFLSKSIHETKGFFWAWAIHFAQDVVILFFLFMKN